jgi:hypothetical protein
MNNLFIIRVAALDRSPTPKAGLWSERIVFKSGPPTPTGTPTPTPTYPPTPNVDLNGNGAVDPGDLFVFQKAWGTSVSEKTYNATADIDGDQDVDAGDLTLFQSEARRRRVPIKAPRLVFPPNNYEISMFDVVDGLVFDWDPVPYTPGGILYKFELVRDLDQSSMSLETTRESEIFYSASPGFIWGTGKSFYTWRVWAVSPYGIKPDGPVSENHLIVVGLTGKPTSP